MSCLPSHGRVSCRECFRHLNDVTFDITRRTEGRWRITSNPLAWGGTDPEIVVLGFSKGPTQAGALATAPHDVIAYKGKRRNVGRILRHLGLLSEQDDDRLAVAVDDLISDQDGRFHFGSLIRCTVEQLHDGAWKSSGGGMLDQFVLSPFGRQVATSCVARHLKDLPSSTRLVVMFGMGAQLSYVRSTYGLLSSVRGGEWRWINDVAYTDGRVTVVHAEHFASQGALIPQWLGEVDHPRRRYGRFAQQAVLMALAETTPVALATPDVAKDLDDKVVRFAEKTSRPPVAHASDAELVSSMTINLTGGNIRNGHFYIDRQSSPIPSGAWGGQNQSKAGHSVTIRFVGTDEVVRTDVDGAKRILRNARGQVDRFFKHHSLRAGDRIVLERLGANHFQVAPAR